METDDFYWPPAQADPENACRNMLPTACIVCPCTSVHKTKDHALFNYYMHLNLIVYILSYALGTTYRYFVLSFRISTVFDINPLELVRFRNS